MPRFFGRKGLVGKTIGTKLMAAFLVAALIPLGLVVYLNAVASSTALERAAFRTLFAASSQVAVNLDAFIHTNLNQIGMEARLPYLADYLSKSREDRTIENRVRILDILNSLVRKNSIFISSYALIEIDGLNSADTWFTNIGTDESGRDYFLQALETGLPYVSSVVFSDGPAGPSLYFSCMVSAPSGEPLGVLRARYSAAVLQQLIVPDNGLAGPQSFPMLLDGDHMMLAYGAVSHAEASDFLYRRAGPLTDSRASKRLKRDRLPHLAEDRITVSSLQLEAGLELAGTANPHFNTRLFDPDGPLQAAAVSTMKHRDWNVVFFQPREVFLRPVRAQVKNSLYLAAGVALAVSLAGILGSHFLSKPIRELTEVVESVSEGRLSVRATVSSGDEIGILADSFNSMADRLHRRIEMEKLVAGMSRDFMALGLGEVDNAIRRALKDTGRFIEADRSYVFQFSEGLIYNTFEWCGPGIPSQKHLLQAIPFERFPWAHPMLEEQGYVHVPRVRGLPREADREKRLWVSEGTRSVIAVSMKVGKDQKGLVGFANHRRERSWSPEDIRLLRMVAEIICNALERWRTETALKESEERYALTQHAANIGGWDWNFLTGDVILSGPIEPIFGLRPGQFDKTYKGFLAAVHPDDRDLVDAAVQKAVNRDGAYGVEHRIIRPDGAVSWISERGAVIRDDQGKPVKMMGISQEITERKKAEEELRNHKENLEELIRERTLELTVAKEEAEAANRAKSIFLANMSHELRTPLNAILGFSQIFQKSSQAPAAFLEGVTIIQRSGEHLLCLINDILDSSKIEAGKVTLDLRPVFLSRFLDNITGIIGRTAEDRGIAFKVNIPGDLPGTVLADGTRLQQVLLNLLGNAMKFTDSGRVTLTVAALPERTGKIRQIRFEVADTGIGIARDQLQRIFHPFFQAKEARRKSQGTGLGLSISSQLVGLMGGELIADSTPGKGAVFEFTVPFEVLDAREAPLPDSTAGVSGYHGDRKTVLVADDNPDNRTVLSRMLGLLGFRILQSNTGVQTLALARKALPDLILLDLSLPDINGIKVAGHIRRAGKTREIPMVACSAGAFEQDRRVCLAAGCNAFLPKPLKYPDLQQVLKRVLDIDWIYEAPVAVDPPAPSSAKLRLPGTARLRELDELARYGNMRKIRQWAEKMARAEPEFHPFWERVRTLAKSFREQDIVSLVGEGLGGIDLTTAPRECNKSGPENP